MFKHDKLYVCDDIADREALCKRLTDNGATIVPTVGEQDSIHIFNSFEGVLFDDCLKKGCRIIGLPCLQETLQSGKALPRTPYPVYSRVMEGIVVSSDVVEQKAKLKSYVHQMNGIWADELSGDTQYFITNEPGSIHYLWALEYGSNIVQPSWITESWENRVLSNPKSHVLPPLHGCVISVTGFSVGTRNTIQNLVMHYGGKYMQQLSRKVTHLLCDKPGGRKFATAVSWGIHVVNTNWLYDSINAKGMVDATRYEMPPEEGHGGDTLRSPYSRSGPYGSLSSHHHLSSSSSSSSRPRIVGFAPVLVRRNRVPASNYAPMFSIPSTHQHQFAQTSQIQASSHHSLGLSHSSLRNQPIPQRNRPPPRSRDREGRTSMDKYRDMIEQVTGLLRMCDDIIEKTTAIQNTNNNNNDITNFSNILNSSITSNIKSLYNNLDQLCNNSNDNISNDITTTTTTTSSTLPDTNNNNNNTNTTTNNKDNSATDIQTTNKEESTTTDMEMESDDEPPSSATPSEHEK